MGAWRARPPAIFQSNRLICWATALASWTQATVGVPDLNTTEVIDKFRALGVVNDNETLDTVSRGKAIVNEYSLNVDRQLGGGSIDLAYLAPKLKKSHVLVIYRRPGATILHTVVVYGADQLYVCFMDPAHGTHRTQRSYEFGDGADDFLVMWRK